MNALKITVFLTTHDPITFDAKPDRSLRALIGKHGELRILQIHTYEDVDIETKQQKETFKYIAVYNTSVWTSYENDDII